MNPTIHNSMGNDLETQGYGSLTKCISCEVTEVLNGEFSLELTYPLNAQNSEYLLTGNIIVAQPNHTQSKQPFRISEVRKSFSNNIQVYANHICYDLSGFLVEQTYSSNSLTEVIAKMNEEAYAMYSLYGAPYFHFRSEMIKQGNFSMEAIQTLRSWMGGQEGSIIDTYGGEWFYDNYWCYLTKRRGQDTGFRISYGKNLVEYSKEKEYNEYSHVCAYWKKSEEVVSGDLISTGLDCPFRCGYVDASNAFEEQPTDTQLNTYATEQIQQMKFGTQTITVTPAQLGDNVIGLGDTVLVCYENVFSTRVIKTVWDVITETYKTLQLGTKKANIADTIKSLNTAPSGESGTEIVVDSALSTTSENPVQNKVIANALSLVSQTANNNFSLRKIGNKIAELRCYGIRYPDLRAITVPVGYRPTYPLSWPAVILLNGKAYQCYVTISTAGVLQCQYYDYAGSPSTPVNACEIYCTCVYFLN